MARIPGQESDIFFGDVDAPPRDWRTAAAESEPDDSDTPITAADREYLAGLLGADVLSADDGEPTLEILPADGDTAPETLPP